MGVVMRKERERGKKRESMCVYVVKSSVRGRGGDVKVKYINHSLAGLITSVLGEGYRQHVGGYTVPCALIACSIRCLDCF